ncbi:MAG: penicillin-binding protein 1C [Desulfovibrionaceae bacterium]
MIALRLLLYFGLAVGLLLAVFLILDRVFPFPEQALHRPPARLVLDRQARPLRAFLPPDAQWRFPVELDEVSPVLLKALIRSEDRWFRYHPGVNPVAVLRAAWTNLTSGRVVSGGSTITMQVARLCDPRPRTIRSKMIEAFRALQLRWHHSPDEILQWYVNMAPFGGNVVGVGAAARYYFDKTPDRLSLGEAALLTALPRSPNTYDPVRHPEAAKAARTRVLNQMHGLFPPEMILQALDQPLPDATLPPPMFAPHFSQWAASELQGARVQTSLDFRAQRLAEESVRNRINGLRNQGIESAAAVVLNTTTHEILAMVGAPFFFDEQHSGQINGALIRRSPGSTLKPFLYALAMDQGFVHPESLLLDIPTDYSGYAPENYDGTFHGAVTAREALAHSLNVPAVRLLAEIGLTNFLELLHQGGMSSLDRPTSYYGLPLVLGGGEVTLLELTNLYACLASGGRFKPVRRTPGDSPPGARLFTAETCFLITEILAQVERPDMPKSWALTADAPETAWKTGTSFGHRDAWAVGYSGNHTIGVWVGNLDGSATKGISGARHAGPLLFDLFRAIEGKAASLPNFGSLSLSEVELCAESRMLPGPFCTDRVKAQILPGVTRLEPDNWTIRVFIDDATGLRLSGDCLADHKHHTEILVRPPIPLAAWRESVGLPVDHLPEYHPDCISVPDQGGPLILSPDPNTPYRIRRDAPPEYQRIPLLARTPPGSSTLYWFVDGRLIGSGSNDGPLFLMPQAGEHRVSVSDEQGRSDAVTFIVE